MSIISRMRKQKCVWWKKKDQPNLLGEDIYEAPEVIDCRWQDSFESVLTPEGKTITSAHEVFVDRDLSIGDMLLKGSTIPEDHQTIPNHLAKRIVSKKAIPNLRNTETLYIVYL
jgi:hypothetical protein